MNATTTAPLPPHSIDAEKHLLACCLLEDSSTLAKCLDAGLVAAAFYSPEHRAIYAMLCALYKKHGSVSVALLGEELKATGQLETVGGFPYLTEITQLLPAHTHEAYFIGKVREHYVRRQLQKVAQATVEAAADLAVPVADLVNEARDGVEAADNLAAGGFDRLSAISAADLCSHPPETPAEIIHGVLYRGGTAMISAPSKGHKTYTMLDAVISITSGKDWLGFKTTATPVLYVNLELAGHSTARRLTSICAARRVAPPANLHFLNLRGRHVTAATLQNVVVPMATGLGAGLIVIDPYYKISSVSGVEENSNDGQAVFLAQVEAAARDASCAIIMVHHFAKGDSGGKNSIDRASGGGVLARWPDVIATLTEHETEDCMVADFHLRDFAPISSFVLRWECPLWVVDAGEDPAKVKRGGRSDQHPASDLLVRLDPRGMTNAEWLKASGWPESTYRRKRHELETAGKVAVTMNVWKPC